MTEENVKETRIVLTILAIVYFISFIVLVVQTVIVTKHDPSDPTIKLWRTYKKSLKDKKLGMTTKVVLFNEEAFKFFCSVCNSYVMNNSKHCQKCNRCTSEFDHHCLWINNDIGLLNYAGFMRMIIALLIVVLT